VKVLVTGGTGYIGSHAVLALIDKGYQVVVYDNLSNSTKVSIDRISRMTSKTVTFFKGDLCCTKSLENVFRSHEFEAVLHFAGLKAVSESVLNPLQYYTNNVNGTLNLLEIMSKNNVKKLVFSSSATVYGNPLELPLRELSPKGVITNPYGRSKLMIEEMLNDLQNSDKAWSIMSLRYFNPIGAHESGLIGEDPSNTPNNLMPFVTQTALGKQDFLPIFGDDYDTHDGTGVRDFIHVMDLAEGHLKALETISHSNSYWTVNLGTGLGYSVLDLVKAFERAAGLEVPLKVLPRRPGDISTCFADVSYSKVLMGWTAKRDLNKMCEDAWHWQKNNPNGYEA
jgi:UDP-glucose 4-epimerase